MAPTWVIASRNLASDSWKDQRLREEFVRTELPLSKFQTSTIWKRNQMSPAPSSGIWQEVAPYYGWHKYIIWHKRKHSFFRQSHLWLNTLQALLSTNLKWQVAITFLTRCHRTTSLRHFVTRTNLIPVRIVLIHQHFDKYSNTKLET